MAVTVTQALRVPPAVTENYRRAMYIFSTQPFTMLGHPVCFVGSGAFLGTLWGVHMKEMWPVSQGCEQERNCHLLNNDLEGSGPRCLLHQEHKMANVCF